MTWVRAGGRAVSTRLWDAVLLIGDELTEHGFTRQNQLHVLETENTGYRQGLSFQVKWQCTREPFKLRMVVVPFGCEVGAVTIANRLVYNRAPIRADGDYDDTPVTGSVVGRGIVAGPRAELLDLDAALPGEEIAVLVVPVMYAS